MRTHGIGRFLAMLPLAVLAMAFACQSSTSAILLDGNTPTLIPQPRTFVVTNGEQVPFTCATIDRSGEDPQITYAAECVRNEQAKLHNTKTGDSHLLLGVGSSKNFVDLCATRGISITETQRPMVAGRFRIIGRKGAVAVIGDDGAGVIYGAYALLQLARDGRIPAAFTIDDEPTLPIRFYRPAQTKPPGLTALQRKRMELDWCARWRCNYMITADAMDDAESGERLDLIAECTKRAIVPVAMLKEVKRFVEEPGTVTLDQIRAIAEERLKQGFRGFHVTFDDLKAKIVKGRAEALAKDQIAIIETIARACEPYQCSENVFWCPTYYSTVVEKGWYQDDGTQREIYYKTLAKSDIVRRSPMYHCHQWKSYAEYLNGLGFNNIVWWYNGARPFFYLYPPRYCEFPMQPGWWDGTKEVGDLPLFVWGWHLLFSELPYKAEPGTPRDVPPEAWQDLRDLPKRFRGVYNCTGGTFAEYNHALYGVYSWNPALFEQGPVEAVIIDQTFGAGTAKILRSWSDAYDALAMKVGRTRVRGKEEKERARESAMADLQAWEKVTKSACDAIDGAKHPLPDAMVKYYRDSLGQAVKNMEEKIAAVYGPGRPRNIGVSLALAGESEVRKAMPNFAGDRGVLKIAAVEEDGPAERGGAKVGDLLLAINGKSFPVEVPRDVLKKAIAETPHEKFLTLLIFRAGVESTLTVQPE